MADDPGRAADDPSEAYFRRLVDLPALEAYLEERLGPADAFAVERHPEGHSNETLFVTWGDRDLVLRRPPPGETAETAHDVRREFRVIDALQDTPVRVPTTVLACDDHDVIGSDFYVMERVRGDVLRSAEVERFATPAARRRVGEELVDALAEIHAVDVAAVGLETFGHPEGYTQRQVDRWRRQYAWAFEVTREVREVPAVGTVGDWLAANVPPEGPHTLVHGDYKLDNVLFATGTPPRLVSVFDWELSTLGDPRADLGWMLVYWYDEGDPPPAVPELTATFMTQPGYLTRGELVERYATATGVAFDHERFFRALAVYKLGALGEMFLRRYIEGNSDDPMYPKMETRVPALAERARRIIEGEEPL